MPQYRRLNSGDVMLVVPGFGVMSRLANLFFAIVGFSSPEAE